MPDETKRLRARRRGARKAVRKARLSAMLVSRPQDVRYLSGFAGEDSFLLLHADHATLITDGRFQEQAARECPGVEIVIRTGPIGPLVLERLEADRVRTLGVQSGHITVGAMQRLAKSLKGRKVRAVSDGVSQLRQVKDDGEVRTVRRAIAAAQKALRGLLRGGAKAVVGRTERDIAGELDYRMAQAGAERPSFETIVAAGPHASLPHYRPGSAKVRAGQCLLIDWGAVVGGYCSDLTRTFFVGRIPPASRELRELEELYPVVLRAQRAGIAAARAGAACRDVDAAAREVIERAGHGEHFLHGLGHGLGLEIHEAPGVGRLSQDRLRAGMVITVEPGLYLPGVGGIRIEDDVLVTAEGPVVLSTLGRNRSAAVLA